MLIFHWDKRLELGVDLLDQQHRQVIECINAFSIRRKCQKGKNSVADCLKFLLQYIQYHFQTEEAFQVESNYSGYRHHQAIHKSLSTRVKFFAVRLESSEYNEAILDEFYEFLVDWVTHHIMQEDMAFAAHYQAYTAKKRAAAIDGDV